MSTERSRGPRATLLRGVAVLAMLWLSTSALRGAGSSVPDDPWKAFEPLLGTWKGTGRGPAGESRVERIYERVLDGHFVHVRTRSVFAGNEAHPDGEVHEDWGMISFDPAREAFVLREFYTEGYVNTFLLDPQALMDGVLVFTTESSEGAPPGMRARTTLEFPELGVMEELFELAMPGADFEACVTSTLERE